MTKREIRKLETIIAKIEAWQNDNPKFSDQAGSAKSTLLRLFSQLERETSRRSSR